MRRLPGYRWRILAHRHRGGESIDEQHNVAERVCFDELVIDDWLHLEQMDTRCWWANVCGHHLWINIPASGRPFVMVYSCAGGGTPETLIVHREWEPSS